MPLNTSYSGLRSGIVSRVYQNVLRTITGAVHQAVLLDNHDSYPYFFITYDGARYLVVRTADSASTNGTNLLATYALARTLTPGGNPLSVDNQVTILLLPAVYDLGNAMLSVDTDWINLIGWGPRDQVIITGSLVGGDPDFNMLGTIVQTATSVQYENMIIRNTANSRIASDQTDGGAFGVSASMAGTTMRNVRFDSPGDTSWPIIPGSTLDGTFENCDGSAGWGRYANFTGSIQQGTFGDYFLWGAVVFRGKLQDITAGDHSYCYDGSIINATIQHCNGGDQCFAYKDTNGGDITNSLIEDVVCQGQAFGFGGVLTGSTFRRITCTTFCFAGEGGTIDGGCAFVDVTCTDMGWCCSESGSVVNSSLNGSYTRCSSFFGWGSTNTGSAIVMINSPHFNSCSGAVASSNTGDGGKALGTYVNCNMQLACGGGTGNGGIVDVLCVGGSGRVAFGGLTSGNGGTILLNAVFMNHAGGYCWGRTKAGNSAGTHINCGSALPSAAGSSNSLCMGGFEVGSESGLYARAGQITGIVRGGFFNYMGEVTRPVYDVELYRANNVAGGRPLAWSTTGSKFIGCKFFMPYGGTYVDANVAANVPIDGCVIQGVLGANVTNTAVSPHNY